MVTRTQLKKLFPHSREDLVKAIVDNWGYAVAAGLTKPARVRAFFANVGAETGGLSILEENMNYSITRMMQVWPRRFPTRASAAPYAHNPRKLANHVYGGRMGNAREPSDDGYNYRGSGLMQTTGKNEFKHVGYVDNPDVLRKDPVAGFKSAIDLWKLWGLNEWADQGRLKQIRRKINGGYNGLQEMYNYHARALKVWPDNASMDASEPVGKSIPEDQADKAYLAEVALIKEAQTLLIKLGYTEVGRVDGSWGPYTKTAVLAFRSDNDLPPGGIDKNLIKALKKAKPRVTERSQNPVPRSKVRSLVPEALSAFYTRIISGLVSVFMAIAAFIDGIWQHFTDADDKVSPLKGYLPDVPLWGWLLLVIIISATIYLLAKKSEDASQEAYLTGERR